MRTILFLSIALALGCGCFKYSRAQTGPDALGYIQAHSDLTYFDEGSGPSYPPTSCTLGFDPPGGPILRHACIYVEAVGDRIVFQSERSVAIDLRDVNLFLSGPDGRDREVVNVDSSPFERVQVMTVVSVCVNAGDCSRRVNISRLMRFRTPDPETAKSVTQALKYLVGVTTGP
jgi:hypothetical protein